MADTLTLYSFEDKDGNEPDTFTTMDYQEAKVYAQENSLRVMANEYEWAEAVPVDDFTKGDAVECPKCGEEIEPGDMIYNDDDHEVCPHCAEELER